MHSIPVDLPARLSWRWIALGWAAFALLTATQNLIGLLSEGMAVPTGRFLLTQIGGWLPWLAGAFLVLRLSRVQPFTKRTVWRVVWWHLALLLAIALAHSAWVSLLVRELKPWGHLARPRPFMDYWIGNLLNQVHLNVALYAAVLMLWHTVESRHRLQAQALRASRLEVQLSQAQLQALRRQLEPHFLFNALNGIAGLVRDERYQPAVAMIAGLSDLLRHVLEQSDRQEVPLQEELEFLESYLSIQRMRFTDRLQVELDIPADLRTAQVPSLILQPLAENAIEHGISRSATGGTLEITACRAGDGLEVRVYNDGPALRGSFSAPRMGVGLTNTRARLRQLYGDGCDLVLRNHEEGGVEAVLTLPYRTVPR